MKYTDTEIRDLYNSYDEVVYRICVLNTIIRSPESTFGQVNMAKAERERLIPRKRELEKQVNLVEKLFRLQFTSQAYVQEILTGSPKIFARKTLPFMKESDEYMFNLFKKKPEPKLIHYLSLFWDPKEEIAIFDPFFREAMKQNVTIIGMRFIESDSLIDKRHVITFKALGTYDNLNKLEASIPEMDGMDIFKQND